MPYAPLLNTRIPVPLGKGEVSIVYRTFLYKSGESKPRLIIGLSLAVANRMKIENGQRFAIAIGFGVDKGKARIFPSADGAPACLSKSCSINFGHIPSLGQEEHKKKEFVEFRVFASSLELDLPPWFEVSEQ